MLTRDRAAPVPTQTQVEKFNFQINQSVLIPIRELINFMESAAILDKYNDIHVGAFSSIMVHLMQCGLNRLR